MARDFWTTRVIETGYLWLPFVKRRLSEERALEYGLNPDPIKFYGRHPLTGLPVTIVFNEPAPGRKSLMNWNTLTKCWFYSDDAGLTWEKLQYKKDFLEYIEKVDCLMESSGGPIFEH